MPKNSKIILDIIEKSYDHPTAEDIHKKVAKAGFSVSIATVYNNLSALADAGLIRRLVLPDGPCRYDKLRRHDHLVCSECGGVADLELPDLKGLLEERAKIDFDSYELQLFQVCDQCRLAQEN